MSDSYRRTPSQRGQGEGVWEHGSREHVAERRRWMRRVKAVASIGLAVAAGTFLACTRREQPPDKSPPAPPAPTPSAKQLPAPDAAETAPSADAGADATAADAADDATTDAAQAIVPAPKPKPPAKPKVDRKQHRKGMPVPDNLLE